MATLLLDNGADLTARDSKHFRDAAALGCRGFV